MRTVTTLSLSFVTFAVAGITACSTDSISPTRAHSAGAPLFSTGLPGNPSSALYKFNMIGVSDPKQTNLDGDQGKRMFVLLDGHSTINLQQGETFDILDANATDKDGGLFQLPDPDPNNTGVTTYGVYVRTLGTPGGSAKLTSCVTGDPDGAGPATTGTFCSVDTVTISRSAGKPKVTNVSRELLTTCVDLDGDGTCDKRIFLFDDALLDYAWSVDNNGLRIAQFWFFPIPQNIGLNP